MIEVNAASVAAIAVGIDTTAHTAIRKNQQRQELLKILRKVLGKKARLLIMNLWEIVADQEKRPLHLLAKQPNKITIRMTTTTILEIV